MSQFMIQLAVPQQRFARWLAIRDLGGSEDHGYGWHVLLTGAFGRYMFKPYHVAARGTDHILLGYSDVCSDTLRREIEATAMPEIAQLIDPERIAHKKMPEQWEAGAQYGFAVRVQPVKRVRREGRSRDLDVHTLRSDPELRRDETYGQWLGEKLAAGGAEPLQLYVNTHRSTSVLRPNKERKKLVVSTMEAHCSGLLRVTDPERFTQLLTQGIGRGAAFGFGMLRVRQA